MVCILLHMLCSFAMSSETRLNFFVSYSLKFVVMLFVSSLLYFCESISYKFLVFSAKTKTLDVDCIFLASLAGMLRNWSLTFRNSRFSIIFSISFRNLLILLICGGLFLDFSPNLLLEASLLPLMKKCAFHLIRFITLSTL